MGTLLAAVFSEGFKGFFEEAGFAYAVDYGHDAFPRGCRYDLGAKVLGYVD